jgi:hypothetical protein
VSITKSGGEERLIKPLSLVNERWTTSFEADSKIRGKRRGLERNSFFSSLCDSSS